MLVPTCDTVEHQNRTLQSSLCPAINFILSKSHLYLFHIQIFRLYNKRALLRCSRLAALLLESPLNLFLSKLRSISWYSWPWSSRLWLSLLNKLVHPAQVNGLPQGLGLPGHCAGPLSLRFASGSCQKKERTWPCWHVCLERPPRSQGLQSSGIACSLSKWLFNFQEREAIALVARKLFPDTLFEIFLQVSFFFLSSTLALIPFL